MTTAVGASPGTVGHARDGGSRPGLRARRGDRGLLHFLAESAPPARRGLWSSSLYVAVTCGTVFATVEGAILSSVLDNTEMAEWGWRIPFIIGTLLFLYAFYLRRGLPETLAFEKE